MSIDNPLTDALDKMAQGALEKAIASMAASLTKIASTATDPKMAAFEGLMNEVSAALSDVVSALERDDGADEKIAKAITEGLRALRIEAPKVTVTPEINVSVSPTPIQNNVNVPAPVVHITERESKGAVNVEFHYGSGGVPTGMTITRN